ncbi:GNAT family N-acetyltransferase, partial [Mesorhizobium sp. M8A.F.Ca.ET.202.01.1.1]
MSAISIRRARETDVAAIVAMLADDALGRARENASLPLARAYQDAFAAIDGNPDQFLAVMTQGAEVIGTLQISFLPGLSLQGAWRGQIEAVRVA